MNVCKSECQHSVVGGTRRFVSAAPKSPTDYLLPEDKLELGSWHWKIDARRPIADSILSRRESRIIKQYNASARRKHER